MAEYEQPGRHDRQAKASAARAPREPAEVVPEQATPMTMLAIGSTITSAACEEVIGPAWKAFWVRNNPHSPPTAMRMARNG